MSPRPFEVRLPLEQAYRREAGFAVELLDPVSLMRVSNGATVTAAGLAGLPVVNFSGLFVWLAQPMANFHELVIEPGMLPFESMAVPAAQVQRPLHTVELRPCANYPFTPGITAIRGSLHETRAAPGSAPVPVPVPGATIRLEWLHEDASTWKSSAARAVTNAQGDFTSVLRLAPGELPALDAQGKISIRLFAKRGPGGEKFHEFQLRFGRVADETYAWDELV